MGLFEARHSRVGNGEDDKHLSRGLYSIAYILLNQNIVEQDWLHRLE